MPTEGESDEPRPSATRVGRAPSEPSIAQPSSGPPSDQPAFAQPLPPRFVPPDRAEGFGPTATPNTNGSSDLSTLPDVDRDLYSVGFEIARGGMGRIFAARDRKLRRDIVLKTLTEGGHVPRFEREALITARLQHPSIVRVYDAGRLSGDPFYAMEYVRGKSLDKVVVTKDDPGARLALLPHVIAIADALAYAHSEGVIHRDLKPANVLVGSFGETVVIDWGLAKDLNGNEPDSIDPDRPPAPYLAGGIGGALGAADMTAAGAVMGTPSYMPPEQARGERADERSDVYAIGAILYYVLSGTPPTSGMTALEDAKAGGITPLRERAPEAPEELITIVEHAMAFAPDDRYHSARDLADDLKRFAAGKLVARHAYSTGALARRWLRRHRAAVGIIAAVVILLGGLSGMWIRGLASERDSARDELTTIREALDKAEATNDDLALHQAERAVATDPTLAIAWLARLSEKGLARAKARELASAAAAKGIAFELAGPRGPITGLALAQPIGSAYVASDDGALYRFQLGAFRADNLGSHDKAIVALAASPDGFWLATAGADQQVKIWDLENVQGRSGAKHGGPVHAVAFSPDGNTVASVGTGTLWLWTVIKNEGHVAITDMRLSGPIAWTADGKLVVTFLDGQVSALDPSGRKSELIHAGDPVRVLAVSPNGRIVAAGMAGGSIEVWSIDDPHPKQFMTHADGVRSLAFASDDLLVSAGADGKVTVRTISAQRTLDLATRIPVTSLAVTATQVAAACSDGKVRLWPITGGEPRVLAGHRAPVTAVAFSADGQKLVSVADDRLRLWPLAAPPPAPTGAPLAAWLAARTNVTVAK